MGSVSHKLLVRSTLMPLIDISLQAFSIIPTLSPRLLPRAMYAFVFLEPSKSPGFWVPEGLPAEVKFGHGVAFTRCMAVLYPRRNAILEDIRRPLMEDFVPA